MKNRKVTNQERAEVLRRARLGGKGNLQKKIARGMGLTKDTVRAIEARAGLRRNPGYCVTPEQERAALALFLDGHGQPHIMQALGIPSAPVRELIARFRDRQARGKSGCRYEFSALEKRAIRRDLREARRAVARKWEVTLPWIEEFVAIQKHKHREAHEPAPFLPKSEDLVRLLRTLLPAGIPFDARRDSAAVEGLMQGVNTFIALPTQFAHGLRSRFGEAMSMLRREQNGEWIH